MTSSGLIKSRSDPTWGWGRVWEEAGYFHLGFLPVLGGGMGEGKERVYSIAVGLS